MSESAWKLAYKKLALNPDFLKIWEEGPIAEKIHSLQRQLQDITITDPGEIADIRNQLWGLNLVREAVFAKPPEPQESPFTRLRRAVSAGRFLPRPLG